ncbi:hypothetical protein EVAR_95491_1 [Eumeta japonica]|uniref:ADF-H domain-containing protein n=1 Tax=Eumeta variegata TaxID=151549 RepID=A0A4C1UJH6_EUMVA|nr:hypothetical protein EVAR_95491_1 [Eumeta japonica]
MRPVCHSSIVAHTVASGVTVSDACKTTYEEIKKDKKHRYVVFYIRDEKQIDVETVGERNAEYDQFLEDLQKGGTGEYGLYDFEYTHQCQGTSEASKKQKLFLMSWCPDTAKVKKKMLYSRSVPSDENLLRCAEEVASRRSEVHTGDGSLRGVPGGRRGEAARHRSPVGRAGGAAGPGRAAGRDVHTCGAGRTKLVSTGQIA